MIDQKMINYIRLFEDKEQVLLFIFNIRHPELEVNAIISSESLFKLISDNIIDRDYVKNKYSLLVPFYNDDEGQMPSNTFVDIIGIVNDNIPFYRSLFKGIRPGSMGDPKLCQDNMVWLLSTSEITFDKVIEATMHYLQHEDPGYIMNADNFIRRLDGTSKLLRVVEELPESKLL